MTLSDPHQTGFPPRHDDPAFPALHGRPARGWVNDPNGLGYVDGRWHMFFQYNPDAPVHDQIAWGHASSDDLITWVEEPVALRPQPGGPDALGCWSGCLTLDDGVPTTVYSGISDRTGASQALLARSDAAMQEWKQDPRPAVGMPDDQDITDVRDPFVVTIDGRRYVVQGAGSPHGKPSLLLYDAEDLTSWRELGTLLDTDDPIAAEVAPANIWECPNLVRMGDTWLLVLSLWRWAGDRHELAGVRWLTGDLAPRGEGLRFVPTRGGRLDAGPAFYAPQLLAVDGRVLMWAWSWELDRSHEDVGRYGWAGVLTFPRELRLADGILVSAPATELDALRRGSLGVVAGQPFAAAAFEAALPAAGSLTLLSPDGDEVGVARWESPATPVTAPRLYVDGSLVEVFSGGPETYTTRAYPVAGSTWRIDVDAAPGGRDAAGLQVWSLGLPD